MSESPIMTSRERVAIDALRRKGWAVVAIPPIELDGVGPQDVEDAMFLEAMSMTVGE